MFHQGANDQPVLTTFGRSSGFCVDPVEKKLLTHFLLGTPVLSWSTYGRQPIHDCSAPMGHFRNAVDESALQGGAELAGMVFTSTAVGTSQPLSVEVLAQPV